MRPRTIAAALIAATALLAAACGDGESKDNAAGGTARAVDIEMMDTMFVPDHITVPAGEEVRLVFHNTGKVDHDAFIGDEMAQNDHEAEMQRGGGMHHGGGGTGAITVEPGKTATLTHTFEAGGNVLIGCHQPGHYGSGMKMTVEAA